LARFIREASDNIVTGMNVRTICRRDRYLRASDHVSFLQQGYPAVRLTEEAENFAVRGYPHLPQPLSDCRTDIGGAV
jgi:hypothetical protein